MGSVFDLFAKLSLDSSEYDKGLDNAKSSAESGGSKIGAALGNAAKVGAAAVTAASTAVTAFAKSSVDAGMSFDSSMAQVAATMGVSMEELQSNVGSTETAYGHFEGTLRDFAQFLGANTAFSATQAAEALNYMALAGYDTQESMEMLPTVLDLAAAGGIDLAYASDMVTDAQSALGLSAEETAEMVDKMAMASSKSNTSVAQLGEAILTIGATARSVKGGTTELATVLGVLADNGIKGTEGGTHLRNIIMSLQSPTDSAAQALDALGVAVYDSDGNMRSLVDIVADMQTGLDGMDQASRDAMINGIFNKTDVAAVNALLNTSQDRFSELTGEIENAQGAAQRMAETQLDNLAGDVTLFQSALEGAKIAISDVLTPSLREFVQFGTESVSALGTAFKEDGLAGALNALGPIIDQGVQLLFDALPKVIEAGIALLDALVTAIINNLPKLVPAAIQLVQSLADNILENLPKLIESAEELILSIVEGLITALPQLIPVVVQIITTLQQRLTDPELLAMLVDAAIAIILALADGLIAALPQLIENAPIVIQHLVDALIENAPKLVEAAAEIVLKLGTAIKDYLPEMLQAGVDIVFSILSGIVSTFEELIRAGSEIGWKISDGFDDFIEAAKEWGQDLIDNLIAGIKQKWESLKDTVRETAQKIKDFLGFSKPEEGPLSDADEYGGDFIDLIIDGIRGKISDVASIVNEVAETVHNAIADLIDSALSWGHDLIQNFINGIWQKAQDLWDTVKGIAQGVRDFIGFSEPKKGPLSDFHTFAPDMMQLFAKGIKDNEDLVTAQIGKSFDFRAQMPASAPALAAGPTQNTWNITVNGIAELDEIVRWYQGRQVEGRMV